MYLTETPFYILGVTTRDDKQTIIAKAEEKSFDMDPDICAKARAELTHPRKRLAAEMAWLPRISIKKSDQIVSRLNERHEFLVDSLIDESDTSRLATLNSITTGFFYDLTHSEDYELEDILCCVSAIYEEVDALEVMRQINADRSVSRFPIVQDLSWIEKELTERRRHYVKSILDVLNKLPALDLVETVTALVEGNTDNGELAGEAIVCDLVDRYEESVQGFLDKEAENVRELIKRCGTTTENSGSDKQVDDIIAHLSKVLRNWDRVAQPIQLIAKSRGTDHSMSNDLASEVRSLAVDLHNEHGLTKYAKRLTSELEDIFAEAPDFVEQIKADTHALDEIIRNQQEADESRAEWENEISFTGDFGHFPFKKKLKISSDGLLWGETLHPFDSISEVLWGATATQHSTNGIITGTSNNYVIKLKGSGGGSVIIKPEFAHTYQRVIKILWNTVGDRILMEMIHALAKGNIIHIGKTRVSDNGIELIKHNMLTRNTTIFLQWSEVTISNGNGSFLVSHKTEKKTYAEFPYMEIYNAHLLETAVRSLWENGGTKLSAILEN